MYKDYMFLEQFTYWRSLFILKKYFENFIHVGSISLY